MPINVGVSPSRLALQQNLGSGLTQQGLSGGPTSALGGLGRIAQTIAGGLILNKTNQQQQERDKAAQQALMSLLGGSGAAPAPAPGGAPPGVAGGFGGPITSAGIPVAGPRATQLASALPTAASPSAQLAAGVRSPGPDIAQALSTLQQFPSLAPILGPMISAQMTPQKPTVLPEGATAVDAAGNVVARGTPKQQKFATDLGKAMSDRDLAIKSFGKDSSQAQAFNELVQAERSGTGEIDLTDEAGQRKEFTKASGDFVKVRDAFEKIQASRASAAGDLALIFNYMRLLDPGSTVREGEFANAQNSAGIPDRVRATYNNLVRGERLSIPQRADFKGQAGDLFLTQQNAQNQLEDQFRGVAGRSGLRPENVVLDFQGGLRNFTQPAPPGAAPAQPAPTITGGAPAIGSVAGGAAAATDNNDLLDVDLGAMTAEQRQQWLAEMDRRGL